MKTLSFCLAYAVIVAAVLAYCRKKRGFPAVRLVWLGLFLISLMGAFLWKQTVDVGASVRALPFYKLVHYDQYGDLGTLSDLRDYGLPFLPLGLFFLFAFPAMGVCRAALAALVCALIFHAPALIGGARPFVLDEYWFAALGGACGAGVAALVCAFFQKAPWLERAGLRPPRKGVLRAGLAVCGVVYLGIALLLIVDFSAHKSSLTLFESTVELPANTTSAIALRQDDPTRVPVYTADTAALGERAQEIARALGVEDVLQEAGGAYAIVDEQGNSLMMEPSGAWTYEGRSAPDAALPTLEEAEAAVRSFFREKAIPGVELGPLTDSMALRPNISVGEYDPESGMTREEYDALLALSQQTTGYRLYFATMMDGYRLRNGNELVVTVGGGGAVVKIQAMGASLTESGSTAIIPAQSALSRVLSGQTRSYTLFSPALSAEFTGYSLVYFADTVSGEWLPAWSFAGRATLENGEESAFEAYVPAAK